MIREQTAERGVRCALVAVFVAGVRRRDPGAIVNAVVAFAATYVPRIVERVYGLEFRPWQRAYAAVAMLTHAIGMLGPYDDVWWWDHLTHAHSATLVGSAAFVAARRRGDDPRPRVVAVVAVAGLCWELLEYAIHAIANRLGLEPVLVTYGKTDTALDLLFNLVGAVLVLLLGDYALENVVRPPRTGR
ncbi:hypothetical protein [Natrinema longum]|uniref:DUF2238 domain-containing protein n=1 Tax=Natrinema longum TaxID=370324 RepID=A0A8A2UDP1_9EURY|nr:hypothetical protein [Natrinema longum]MBZ6495264.1 hypothetical protein [Natrinema longum]QSW86757.1 hypothetical protein J0X27_08080 [Natrinema longum]